MKHIRNRLNKLSRQLLSIIAIIFGIFLLTIGIILPNALKPLLERSLYDYLKQPLDFVDKDIIKSKITTEIAYIYIYNDKAAVSENFSDIIEVTSVNKILDKIDSKYGKFTYSKKTYYYYQYKEDYIKKVAITNDNYIISATEYATRHIFPIILITMILTTFIICVWSSNVVRRIEKLKNKIDHIDDNDYNHEIDNSYDDEIKSLELAIEDMRISLKNQEEYRNQMYQNISHDFKTPLTVIKSYIEAVSDGVEDKDKALAIISEQTKKLEQKVHSLLYLNKLDYIKDLKGIKLEKIDITEPIMASVEKFKFQNKDIKFNVSVDKDTIYQGSFDAWETVIDNILGNFVRYAKSEIKITIKKKELIFYNDGPKIDESMLEGIFIPFRKGIKGQFGLGLSIVKKTLNIMGYDITVKNNKTGVSFIIKGSKS